MTAATIPLRSGHDMVITMRDTMDPFGLVLNVRAETDASTSHRTSPALSGHETDSYFYLRKNARAARMIAAPTMTDSPIGLK